MAYRLVFLLLLFAGISLGSQAAQDTVVPPLLVISDLRLVSEQSSVAEARAFSDFIRNEIERTGLYRILSRSSMLAILKAKSFPYPCYDLDCFASMGAILGADEVLAGNINRRDSNLEIMLRRIDVKEARFIHTLSRTATGLTTAQLLGDWGRKLIAETFQVSPSLFSPPPGEESLTHIDAKPYQIPDEIANKYPGMIYIPAGNAVVGSDRGDPCEQPPHSVMVNAFYLSRYEVTNEEYREFVQTSGHTPPSHWVGDMIPPGLEKHPVTWVSFEDAEAYCLWRGGRLPTEEEWERAAHGEDPRVYPWGDEFDADRANTWSSGRRGTAPVGSYPKGASLFGVEDMAGNVFEWVDAFYTPYPGANVQFRDAEKHQRVLRGGSWNFNEYYARTTHRFARPGGEKSRSYGIRLARNP